MQLIVTQRRRGTMRKFSIATGLALALCSAPVFADHHEDGGEGNSAVDNAMQAIQDLLH